MSDNISIEDFKRNWTFFMRDIEDGHFDIAYEGRFECRLFSCSGCDDELPNRNFYNWTSLWNKTFHRRKFPFSANSVLKLMKALSSQNWSKNLAKAALRKCSRQTFTEKLSLWNSSHLIMSRRVMSTSITIMDATNIIFRKKFVQVVLYQNWADDKLFESYERVKSSATLTNL